MRSTTSSGLRFLSELAPILGAGDLRVAGPSLCFTLGGGFVLETGKYPEEIVEKVARALAALDALGLTVTEEFGIDYGDEVDSGWKDADGPRRAAERNLRQATPGQRHLYAHTIVRRIVLYAETPWEVVDR